ncbi:MAG: glycosyltransferase family 4 protein [Gemmataceae bacterium]|nr:glycosyltransferase family 4 protein [Gemmataceae bacterium]
MILATPPWTDVTPGEQFGDGEPALKICMLAACPFPANHGTPGSIREMAEAIVERGHEVHIVTYHIGQAIPVHGPQLHRITPLTRETGVVVGPTIRRPLYDLQLVFKTLEVIRDHRPDVIHAHGYEAALAAWLCRTVTGLPTVYSGHNTMGDELASYRVIRPRWLAQGLARLLDAFVPRLADRCLPHSSNIARFLHQQGLGGRTDPVVNFGIDVDWMTRGDGAGLRERHGLGGGPVIVYSGVLDQFQRIDLLLAATAHVCRQEPSARLLIVTTIQHPGHLADIRRNAGELGIADRVICTEPQPLTAVRDLLQTCDVAVVPRPQAPGFPIKLLNYMAASRPCVLFASSASQGLVDGENVRLIANDTSDGLAEGILEVLRDGALRERLARNGHRFVRAHHDRRGIAAQVCATYFRVLAAFGRPPLPTGRPNLSPQRSARVTGRRQTALADDRCLVVPEHSTSNDWVL